MPFYTTPVKLCPPFCFFEKVVSSSRFIQQFPNPGPPIRGANISTVPKNGETV